MTLARLDFVSARLDFVSTQKICVSMGFQRARLRLRGGRTELECGNLRLDYCGCLAKVTRRHCPTKGLARQKKLPAGVRHTARLTAAQHKKRERTTPIGVILSMHPEVPSRFELLYTVLQTVA